MYYIPFLLNNCKKNRVKYQFFDIKFLRMRLNDEKIFSFNFTKH